MAKDKAMKLEKNNRKNLLFIALVIFLIVIITGASCFGIIAWARYRTVTNASAEAGVAKWSFKVNGSSEEIANIDLGETISYEHVAEKRIAPGTSGAFDLVIDGSGSQVSIEYYIDIDLAQKPTNMKFYTDASFSNELEITTDKKIKLEDEILLENVNTPVTRTIYWKWEYRTIEMPTDEVLVKYGIDKTNLLTQYNNAITDEEKEEVLKKVNDKIDTLEAGGSVLLPVKVTGIQKNPSGFAFKSVYVTSSINEKYVKDDEVTLDIEFTEGVYADKNKTAITDVNAPILELEFDGILESSNSLIAVVANKNDNVLRIAEGGNYKTATFVGATANKLRYSYIIEENDKGNLKIASISGKVYNKDGKEIELEKKVLSGKTIIVDQDTIKQSNWQEKGNTEDAFTTANQLLGTAGGRNYYKSNDIPAIGITYYITGARYALISTEVEGTIGYCDYNSSYDNSSEPYQIIEKEGITWYARELPYLWLDGTTASSNKCYDIGNVTSLNEAAQTGISNYFNPDKKISKNEHLIFYSSFDNGLVEDLNNEAYVVNGNITQSLNAKVGTGSAYFSGEAGQRLRIDRDNLNFGTNDFTIEFWAYAEDAITADPIYFSAESNQNLKFFQSVYYTSGNAALYCGSAYLFETQQIVNEWVNYKIVRKNGVFKLYVNGVQTSSNESYINGQVDLSQLAIGGNSVVGITEFKGYVDDFTIYDIALENEV